MFGRRGRMPYSTLRRTVRNLPPPRSGTEFQQEALRNQFRRRRRRRLL